MFGEIISTIIGGGATGLLGSLINSVGDYFKQKQQYAHEEKMAEIETKHLSMEIDRDVKISEQEAEAQMEVAAAETQAESYKADTRAYLPAEAVRSNKFIAWLMAIVDFLRGITRPVLTLYLCAVTTMIYLQTHVVIEQSGGLDQEQAYFLMKNITLGILYLTFTAVGWWFGSRSKMDKVIGKGKF